MRADEDEPPCVSRAEKRRRHLKRVETVERRQKQRNSQHCINPVDRFQDRPGPRDEYRPGLKRSERTDFDHEIEHDEPTLDKNDKWSESPNFEAVEETDLCDEKRDEQPAYIQVDGVIALLRSNERHRQALRDNEMTLRNWLKASSEFARVWNVFLSAGGISAGDFEKLMDGRFRARRIRHKRHLRLVANEN